MTTTPIWHQTTVDEEFLNVLAYGPSGSGKTTGAGSFPDPVILDTENGYKSITQVHGYQPFRIPVTNVESVRQAYKALRDGDHPFQTVIIDSVTDLVKFMLDDVIERSPGRKRPSQGVPGQQDYLEVIANLERFLRVFRDLPMHTVFLALPKTVVDEEAKTTSVLPNVVGALSEKLPALVDVCVYTGAAEVEPSERYPRGIRYIGQTVPSKGRAGKDRSGKLATPVCDWEFNTLAEAFGLPTRDTVMTEMGVAYPSTYGADPEPAKPAAKKRASKTPPPAEEGAPLELAAHGDGVACESCDGRGEVAGAPCAECSGNGLAA